MIDAIGTAATRSVVAGTSGLGIGSSASVGAAQATGAADFGSVLAELAGKAVDTLKAGEAAATAGLTGKASVQDVVEAVMAAEQTLQASIAVRDKVVAAYLELSRMAI